MGRKQSGARVQQALWIGGFVAVLAPVWAGLASERPATESPKPHAQGHEHAHAQSHTWLDGRGAADGGTAPKASLYVCPMHPEVQQQKEGRCPKCGMKLVPKPSTSTN